VGRGVKGAAGAFRAGGKVRRGRQASVVGACRPRLFILTVLYDRKIYRNMVK